MALQTKKAPPAAGRRPVKRSFRIAGHATSISLEEAFWHELATAAARLEKPVTQLVADIDAARGDTNLSSAVRLWILADLKTRLARLENAG
jgi:predicted DNA-binding ribbon-helix-helix protein